MRSASWSEVEPRRPGDARRAGDAREAPGDVALPGDMAAVGDTNDAGDASTGGDPVTGGDDATGPMYEGFGAITRGAESGGSYDVYHVTSLADAGPGTLRDAVSAPNRRIVFDVGGTIALAGDLRIGASYLTIDGSTAPSPGITVAPPRGDTFGLGDAAPPGPVHDVVVHHIRVDGGSAGLVDQGDNLDLNGWTYPLYNVVIDHVTCLASADGCFDVAGEVSDVTISWCLLFDNVNSVGMSYTDGTKPRRRVSLHHNVFARGDEHHPGISWDSQLIDVVNNVVYGWGWFGTTRGFGLTVNYQSRGPNPSANIEGNVFHFVAGLANSAPGDGIGFGRGANEGVVYFADNLFPPEETDAVSNGARAPITHEVTHYPASSLATTVVPYVGTIYPTAVETTLLQQIAADL
jgi:hypothetical protein